ATASLPWCPPIRARGGPCYVHRRSRPVPAAGGREPHSLRCSDGDALLHRAPEEWADAVLLRSAIAGNVRELALSSFRDAAVLVFGPTSGAANGYLAALG